MDEKDPPPNNSSPRTEGYLTRFGKWVLSPFLSKSKDAVDKYHIGKSGGQEENEGYTFLNIHPQNFVLGAGWGIVSGYTSEDFFRPVPDKWKMVRFASSYLSKNGFIKQLAKRNILYPSMVAGRIVTRALLAGTVFDVAERKVAQNFNSGVSSTSSTLAGLIVLSVFFRVTNDIRDSAIASVGILGGYVVGSQIAKLVLQQSKNKKNGSGGDDDK